jgi:hypothetical protein
MVLPKGSSRCKLESAWNPPSTGRAQGIGSTSGSLEYVMDRVKDEVDE